jgi:hypothetical protein
LDEYQETSRRGQAKIYETLKKVDENLQNMNEKQSQIINLLMQVPIGGRTLTHMGIRRLVVPMEPMRRSDITWRKHRDPKEVWEVAHPMVRWVAGPIPGHTCQCS